MSVDIDALYEQFQIKEADLAAALGECEAEQARGRTGLSALRRATVIEQQMQVIAKTLTVAIDDALAEFAATPCN